VQLERDPALYARSPTSGGSRLLSTFAGKLLRQVCRSPFKQHVRVESLPLTLPIHLHLRWSVRFESLKVTDDTTHTLRHRQYAAKGFMPCARREPEMRPSALVAELSLPMLTPADRGRAVQWC
jgi:hypothetical protein